MNLIWRTLIISALILKFYTERTITMRVEDKGGCVFAGCTCGNKNEQSDEIDDEYEDPFFQETIIKCKPEDMPGSALKPSDFPKRIKSKTNTSAPIAILDMAHMELTNIPAAQLAHLEITIADFSNNSILALDEYAFANVIRLEVLDLSSNRLSEIKEGTFLPIKDTLVQLSLKANELSQMMGARLGSSFSGLSKLRLLYLDRNGFTSLPDLSTMTSIEDLSLCHNRLDTLNDPITGQALLPSSLRYLQMSANRLKHITRKTFQNLVNLKYLYLSGNQISYIENDAFSHLTHLTALYLSRNSLKQIPSRAFYSLVNLQRLDLAGQNQVLSKIEDYAFEREANAVAIRKIDLSKNRIVAVSGRAFCSRNAKHPYANLRELDLTANPLTSIDSCILRQMSKGYIEYENNQHSLTSYLFVNHHQYQQRPVINLKSTQDKLSFNLKCDCDLAKAKNFVDFEGECEGNDGALYKISQFKCNETDSLVNAKYTEADCLTKLEFSCLDEEKPVVQPQKDFASGSNSNNGGTQVKFSSTPMFFATVLMSLFNRYYFQVKLFFNFLYLKMMF
jgi:Leucine-rich repeat (LRR) protein